MTAIAIITNGHKEKNIKIKQFEKDIGIKIKLCKCRSPETKGKDESSNRFINWLLPYNNKLKDEKELIDIIKLINNQVNLEINRTTMIPPIKLFAKEKEYLNQLPSKLLLESYVEGVLTQTVPSTLLVNYRGSGYSVPMKFINKRVKLYPIDNKLYIYYNDELISLHSISLRKINYDSSHYSDALKARIGTKTDVDISEMANANLARFDKIWKEYYAKQLQ